MAGKKAAVARAGDPTSHQKTPLGPSPGSPNVFFGGQPAWRALLDVHACPQFDGPKPHVGGVVVNGSTKVFINKFPAVRKGDEIVETGGPPNKIDAGLDKVEIAD